jgi:hypothetical protein
MRSASTSLAATLLLACAPTAWAAADVPEAPDPGAATGKHCFGEAGPRWLATSALAGQLNPKGLVAQVQVGRCLPLVTTPGLLFEYSNLQYGLTGSLAPVYAMPGAFVSIAPLSVFELRAEVASVHQWPIGLDSAGYFPLAGYDAPWKILPAASGRTAQGFTAAFTATLQAELPLAARWSLLAVESASFQRGQLGDAPYYYNTRYDLPMARREWLLDDTGVLLLNHQLSDRVKLRFGATDELLWVKGSGYRANVLGALLAGVISGWPGPRSETQPFLRLGGYTAHHYRKGELQILGGVGMTFDLSVRPRS